MDTHVATHGDLSITLAIIIWNVSCGIPNDLLQNHFEIRRLG